MVPIKTNHMWACIDGQEIEGKAGTLDVAGADYRLIAGTFGSTSEALPATCVGHARDRFVGRYARPQWRAHARVDRAGKALGCQTRNRAPPLGNDGGNDSCSARRGAAQRQSSDLRVGRQRNADGNELAVTLCHRNPGIVEKLSKGTTDLVGS